MTSIINNQRIYASIKYLSNSNLFLPYDMDFGHSIAAKPIARWTDRMFMAAYKMLKKYKQQISNASLGFTWSDIMDPANTMQAMATPKLELKELTPYKTITVEDGKVIIKWGGMRRNRENNQESLSEQIYRAVENIPSAVWKNDGQWEVPLSPAACSSVFALAKKFEFVGNQEDVFAILEEARKAKKIFGLSNATDGEIEIPGFGTEELQLYPYQKAGVVYGIENPKFLLCDDMGLGKTPQSMAIIHKLQAYPAIIVVPASLKYNWKFEWERWVPGIKVWIGFGTKMRLEELQEINPQVVIVNYDILSSNIQVLGRVDWQAIVFDEGHRLKNPSSKRSRAAKLLVGGDSKGNGGARVRIVTTGTPVLNRPGELPHLLMLIGKFHEMFRSKADFDTKYCTGPDASSNENELHGLLRKTCMIRRLKHEVNLELPEIQRMSIPIEIDNRSEYQRAEDDIITYVGDLAANNPNFLATLEGIDDQELIQDLTDRERSAAEERAIRGQLLVKITHLKQLAAYGKIKQAIDWINNFLDESDDKKIIVFAHHRKIQEALAQAFPDFLKIVGGSAKENQQAKELFQDPSSSVRGIIVSAKAGGEGITLTAASTVLTVELGWTPAEHDQMEARSHRIGQKENVLSVYLVAMDTIDVPIAKLLAKKRKIILAIHDGVKMDPGESIMAGVMRYLQSIVVSKKEKKSDKN